MGALAVTGISLGSWLAALVVVVAGFPIWIAAVAVLVPGVLAAFVPW